MRGILAIAGLAGALWSASGYIAAFMRASNAIYDVPEGRPFWKTTPIRIGVTLVIMIMLVLCAVMVVVTGGLARHLGQVLGIGSVAVTVWDIAKWPVLLIIVSLMFAILYWVSPNAKRGFRWVSPGGVVAVAGWLVASGLFAVYVANFGHYNKTYGSIAAVIIFLVWLWVSNLAILLGAEFDAELERGRAVAAGVPLGQEPYVQPRDLRKLRRKSRSLPGERVRAASLHVIWLVRGRFCCPDGLDATRWPRRSGAPSHRHHLSPHNDCWPGIVMARRRRSAWATPGLACRYFP